MTSRGKLVILLRLLLFEVAFAWGLRLVLLLPPLFAVVDCRRRRLAVVDDVVDDD